MPFFADILPASYRSTVNTLRIVLAQRTEFPATFHAVNRLSGHTAAFTIPQPSAGGVYKKSNFSPSLVFSS